MPRTDGAYRPSRSRMSPFSRRRCGGTRSLGRLKSAIWLTSAQYSTVKPIRTVLAVRNPVPLVVVLVDKQDDNGDEDWERHREDHWNNSAVGAPGHLATNPVRVRPVEDRRLVAPQAPDLRHQPHRAERDDGKPHGPEHVHVSVTEPVSAQKPKVWTAALRSQPRRQLARITLSLRARWRVRVAIHARTLPAFLDPSTPMSAMPYRHVTRRALRPRTTPGQRALPQQVRVQIIAASASATRRAGSQRPCERGRDTTQRCHRSSKPTKEADSSYWDPMPHLGDDNVCVLHTRILSFGAFEDTER